MNQRFRGRIEGDVLWFKRSDMLATTRSNEP